MGPAVPLVDAHNYCPRCGSIDFPKTGNAMRTCSSCSYEYHVNPVCAAGAILSDPTGAILLLERAKEPAKRLFGLPGGFAEPGESIENSLRREILEETGLTVGALEYVSSQPNQYLHHGVLIPVVDLFFAATVPAFEIRLQRSEVAAWHRVPRSEIDLSRIAFPSIRSAIAEYLARTSTGDVTAFSEPPTSAIASTATP